MIADNVIAHVIKPLRCFGSRLLATQASSKPTYDNDPLLLQDSDLSLYVGRKDVSSGDIDHLCIEPASHVAFGSFDVVDSAANSRPSNFILDGSGYAPWVDKRMYQAPVATYHQAEAPPMPCADPIGVPHQIIPNGMLHPVLMPVLCPYWGMQVSMTAHKFYMFPTEVFEGTEQCDGPAAGFNPYDDAETSPLQPEEQFASTDVTGARKHRRSRRGGVALRKKIATAAVREEAALLMDKEHECAQLPSLTPTSVTTAQRWADIEDDDDPAEVANTFATLAAEEDASTASQVQCSTPDAFASTEIDIDPVLLELDDADEEKRQFTLTWVVNSFWPLVLTKRGCRIVQKAIVVGSPSYQQQVVDNFYGRVHEAIRSPHANYVLQKCIETMPPERIQFVLEELQGHALAVCRHRYGCRIMQRLIEHCPPENTEKLIDEVLSDTASLCRHQYGNFVIQHILQHGSATQRSTIAEVVQTDIIRLAKHRIASHVVSSAMVHAPKEDVHHLTHAVLRDAGQLADLSRREYGSFVVREVNRAAKNLQA